MCFPIASHANEIDPVGYFTQEIHAKRARAQVDPSADTAIDVYDRNVAEMNAKFEQIPANSTDKEWVKKKLVHMAEVDQYMMKYKPTFNNKTDAKSFDEQFLPRSEEVLRTNIQELKKLMGIYPWFTISAFGREASSDAEVIVQHADSDVDFQKEVLTKLEKLYQIDEVSRKNYAFLYDRVAAHENRPQRYGTQGYCTGPGVWEPCPIEKPNDFPSVDARRKEMNLDPVSMEEYEKVFEHVCR